MHVCVRKHVPLCVCLRACLLASHQTKSVAISDIISLSEKFIGMKNANNMECDQINEH